ncbi:hypothetical protein [Roseibium sp. RKSG952]|uniref:hypothetical protein n=1 Tax=Roseibium sp. RKSG952 TaxID=2529384 RepID=UPI0012BD6D72|nr:hypothetical protein [Roseibium sp. RKSG952]MTH96131.1 hypothetical protein [Roseibium sp. RKSG952]
MAEHLFLKGRPELGSFDRIWLTLEEMGKSTAFADIGPQARRRGENMLAEYEIDDAHDLINHELPEYAPYSQYLSDWRDIVNQNSDGWPYWKAGAKAADKLGALVKKAADSIRVPELDPPSIDEFKKSLAPIRAAATRHNLTAPELSKPASAMRP